jgi:hypothetical protein
MILKDVLCLERGDVIELTQGAEKPLGVVIDVATEIITIQWLFRGGKSILLKTDPMNWKHVRAVSHISAS